MSRDVFSPKENLPFPSHRPIYPDHTSSLTLPGSFYFFHEENCRRRRDRVAARKRERKKRPARYILYLTQRCVCVYICRRKMRKSMNLDWVAPPILRRVLCGFVGSLMRRSLDGVDNGLNRLCARLRFSNKKQ